MAMTSEELFSKASILSEAADRIETMPAWFSWGDSACCVCGFVAQVILRLSQFELLLVLEQQEFWGTWTDNSLCCLQTGIPMPQVVTSLTAAGFTPEEISQMEYLSNPEIVIHTGPLNHEKATDAVRYLRQFARNVKSAAELERHRELQRRTAKIAQPVHITL